MIDTMIQTISFLPFNIIIKILVCSFKIKVLFLTIIVYKHYICDIGLPWHHHFQEAQKISWKPNTVSTSVTDQVKDAGGFTFSNLREAIPNTTAGSARCNMWILEETLKLIDMYTALLRGPLKYQAKLCLLRCQEKAIIQADRKRLA